MQLHGLILLAKVCKDMNKISRANKLSWFKVTAGERFNSALSVEGTPVTLHSLWSNTGSRTHQGVICQAKTHCGTKVDGFYLMSEKIEQFKVKVWNLVHLSLWTLLMFFDVKLRQFQPMDKITSNLSTSLREKGISSMNPVKINTLLILTTIPGKPEQIVFFSVWA